MAERPLRTPETHSGALEAFAPRGRASAPHASARVLALPARDVRGRRERAQHRLLLSLGRQLLRVALLHVLDVFVIIACTLATGRLVGFEPARSMTPALVLLVLISLNVSAAYRGGGARRSTKRIVLAVLLAGVPLAMVVLFPPKVPVPLGFLGAFVLLCGTGLVLERRLVNFLIDEAHARGIGLRRAMIVGRRVQVDDVLAAISDRPDDQQIVGFVSPGSMSEAGALGSLHEIERLLDVEDPDDLVVTANLEPLAMRRVADACFKRGVRLLVLPALEKVVRGWAEPVRVGQLAGYHLHPVRLAMPALALKRLSDLILAGVAAVVCAPLMALIAGAIKLDSAGPVFFRQSRVGLGGREFRMWKFRSMSLAAEQQQDALARLNPYCDGRLFKVARDPRVTRVGRVLRRFSLDELPQLFNVLRGDMSLVGPRPPVPGEVRRYEPRHYVRLSVVPGMTGPWQVNGRNLVTDFEQVVHLERGYIESWSLRTDIGIMFKTVGVVLSGKGAY